MHNLVMGTVFELHNDLGQRTSTNGGAGPIQINILMTVVTIETNSTMLEPWKLAANCMSAFLLATSSTQQMRSVRSRPMSSLAMRASEEPDEPGARSATWHCLHLLLSRLCSQVLDSPHNLHIFLSRICSLLHPPPSGALRLSPTAPVAYWLPRELCREFTGNCWVSSVYDSERQTDRRTDPSTIYDHWLSLQSAACLAQRQSARGAAMTLGKTKALTPSGSLRKSAL